MKKKCIETFKQTYNDPKTKEKKEFSYTVGIVLDTTGYVYRIVNMDSFSIWNRSFKTFKEAEDFLKYHPHNIKNQMERG